MNVMHVAVCTANYVAEETGYSLRPWSWGEAHRATVEAYHGPRFAKKFDALVGRLVGLGFRDLELWVAHLDPARATPGMVDEANAILERHGARLIGYTAGLGRPDVPREEAEQLYRVARALNVPLLTTGLHPANEVLARDLGRQYGIRYAIENHPEKTPAELLGRLDPRDPWVGTVVDTGWWATQGYDPVEAVRALRDHLFHVHLKDVKHVGRPHETCAFGEGIVDGEAVVSALREIGYRGHVSVEHEPEHHDPTPEIVESRRRLRRWLGDDLWDS